MVFHKKYTNDWERFIALSQNIRDEQSSKLVKDVIVLMISIAFVVGLMFFYRFEIKQDYLTYQQAFGVLGAIFSLILIWSFVTDFKMKKIKENSLHYSEIKILEKKLSNAQAILEGFELIESKNEGQKFIEDFLLQHSENARLRH